MQNQYFMTSHAKKQFVERFYNALVQFEGKTVFDFFTDAVKITVTDEKRGWIDYYFNKEINAVFVLDRVKNTIITTFTPRDEVKYREAIFLSKGA